MHILYTHRTQGVGAEGVHIMGMVEGFRDLGHEVEVDCLPGCDPFERNRVTPLGDGSEEVHGQRTRRGRDWLKAAYRLIADHSPQFVFGAVELLYNLPMIWRFGRKLRRRRVDLVYERYALGNFAPALLCRILRVPLMVEVNDSVVIERSRPLSFPHLKRMLERRILSASDLVITVSLNFKGRLLEAYPCLPEAKILVFPNAVSGERFKAPSFAVTEALRTRFGLSRRILLGSAGQFLPWHGLSAFVAATAALAQERDLGFLFIGDGPVRSEVMEVAKAGGVEDRVVFTGMVPHALIPEYLALLDIAVVASSAEHASPMKLMEFMIMGLPVIAPDLPSIREVLEEGLTGRVFRPGDMRDMLRCLVDILEDREGARDMGRRSHDYVIANLTWSGHAHRALEVLGLGRSPGEGSACTS